MSYGLPYHIGCSVWSLKEWVGTFYTPHAKPDHFLEQYATVFNTVEGNTTFYSTPDAERVQFWKESVPEGFKFCFKFPKTITHEALLHNVIEESVAFIERFDPLRLNLGPFLIQLPTQFSPDHLPRLEALLEAMPATLNFAVEVRHPDFYDQGTREHQLVQLLKSFHTDRVIFDTRRLHQFKSDDPTIIAAQRKKPKVPIRFETTGSRPFLRFVATNDILNSEVYLKEWSIIVAEWIKSGLHPYVFIHTPDQVSQPAMCVHFHRMLQSLISIPYLNSFPADQSNKQLGLF